ncbi:MAG: ABC transporter permease [Candidatus Nanopelagicales bacterium]
MTGLLRSEWIKTTSTKGWWILFVIGILLTVLSVLPVLLLSELSSDLGSAPIEGVGLADPMVMQMMWGTMGSAQLIALIIGILSFTGEYRHGTITDTFLTEPRRERVIMAKAGVSAVMAVILAAITSVTVIVLAVLLLPGDHAPIDWPYVVRVAASVALAYALYAVLGVALGALITNQVVAIVLALLWVLMIESLIVGLKPEVGKWLPGGASQSILSGMTATGDELLPPALGVVVLIGYTVVFAALAARTTLRRDIT